MADTPSVKVLVLSHAAAVGIGAPEYKTAGAAGFDLQAAVAAPFNLLPGERRAVPAGLKMAIPDGYVGYIHARSGNAKNSGIGMANGTGVIDSDYRGEIACLLINQSNTPFLIRPGDRVGQMVIVAAPQHPILTVDHEDELGATERGSGGWGSTGQ